MYYSIFLLFCIFLVGINGQCYFNASDTYRLHATKTRYELASGDDLSTAGKQQGCDTKVIYLLTRHGTRYRSREDIEEYQRKLPKIQQSIVTAAHSNTVPMCERDVINLESWTLRMVPSDDNNLADAGKLQQYILGDKLRNLFPSLFNASYNKEWYDFRHTFKNRTRDSAYSFAKGLFNTTDISDINFVHAPKDTDPVLVFDDICNKYEKTVDGKEDDVEETFSNGAEFKSVLDNIKNLTGVQSLTNDDVEVMYEICRAEYALYKISPWCAMFQKEDLQIMEYKSDLEYYYGDMYGFKINQEMTCELTKDIVSTLRSAKDIGGTKRGIFRFGHSSTIVPLFSTLGLFKDDTPLLPTNYKEQSNRMLRTSLIDPFGSNIAVVVYNCSGDFKIQTFVNEKERQIPVCGNNILCGFDTFLSKLGPMSDSCVFNDVCENNVSSTGAVIRINVAILVLLFSFLL